MQEKQNEQEPYLHRHKQKKRAFSRTTLQTSISFTQPGMSSFLSRHLPNRFLKSVLTRAMRYVQNRQDWVCFPQPNLCVNDSYAHKHHIKWSKSNTVTKLSSSQVQWRWETKESFSFTISNSSHTKIQPRILEKSTVTWINVSINTVTYNYMDRVLSWIFSHWTFNSLPHFRLWENTHFT